MTEQKITIPEGFKLEKVSETEYKIVPNKKPLPKTWDEFCEMKTRRPREFFIHANSTICTCYADGERDNRDSKFDKNLLPNEEKAEAILALCQLIQLRYCYNDGWVPDWITFKTKYCLALGPNGWYHCTSGTAEHIFAFKTEELRDEFGENFKDLLDELKPLFQ